MQNDNRAPMKVLGRTGVPKVDAVSIDSMQRLANALNRHNPTVPKGVFRFASFKEADAWLIQMKTRR